MQEMCSISLQDFQITQYVLITMAQVATAGPDGRSRALLVGGGIANFTDVAATFNGIIRALREKVKFSSSSQEDHLLLIRCLQQAGFWELATYYVNYQRVCKNLNLFVVLFNVVQQAQLKAAKMRIYVRRGGPNYQKGLAKMRDLGVEIGIPIEVSSNLILFQAKICLCYKVNQAYLDDLIMLNFTDPMQLLRSNLGAQV
jgi:ATP citrate (pro-S)-lyase